MCKKKMISKTMVLLLISIITTINIFATTAKAALINNLGSITVNGVETGVTVTVYPIIDENFDYSVQQPSEIRYMWLDELVEWVSTNYPEFIDTENLNAVTEAFSEAEAIKIAEFYDKLSVAIKAGDVTLESASITAESETVTFDPILVGNYLILIENGRRVYRPLTANVLHEWNEETEVWKVEPAVVDAKASEPTITKTVTEGLEKDHAGIGDTVSFELSAVIPDYPENATAKQFVVSDKLPESLTLDHSSIKVYGVNAGADPVLLRDAYTKTTTRPAGEKGETATTFSLNFVYSKIAQYTSVKITYDAMLNENAVIGTEGNVNNAYLDYNNNPYVENSWKSNEDSATVYTYGMQVLKVDEDTSEALSGAIFYLLKGEEKVKFISEDGIYRVARADEGGMSSLTVDEHGSLVIHGLDAGTYELVENYAPSGYVKLQKPIKIVIADEDFDGKVEADGEEMDDGILPVTVKNSKGFTLPVTGGAGTLLFSMTGILMMGAGLMLIVVLIKKRNNAK
ncbi:MAG: SpaH/EbpB family LPXTG-anchored major pilin [Dorea sp.]